MRMDIGGLQRMGKDIGGIAHASRTKLRLHRNEWTNEFTIRDDYGSVSHLFRLFHYGFSIFISTML